MTPDQHAKILADQRRINSEQIVLGARENPIRRPATYQQSTPDLANGADAKLPEWMRDLPEEVLGAELLADIETFLGRFVAYPSADSRVAHVLWIAHTHLMNIWESTPRIAFLSPEPGSGKTRALEVSELLVPRPVETVNTTPAYLFRKVSDKDGLPTILFDEIDTVFGPKAKDNEEIRGMLNAGHRRGAMAGRCVLRGKVIETEELPAFCAVAVAGLGLLPDTMLSRSVIVPMRRRSPAEIVEPYRRRVHGDEGHALRDRLAAWAAQVAPTLTGVYPTMPEGVEDRAADVWEALLSVADAAGGDWPSRSRVAAVTLVTLARVATPSLGVRLLADLRTVFGDHDAMRTEDILSALCGLEEAPWADLRGKPIDSRRLANYLKPYSVQSALVRIGTRVARGYKREALHDPWLRYLTVSKVESWVLDSSMTVSPSIVAENDSVGLPTIASVTSVTSIAPSTSANGSAHCGHCQHFKPDTGENGSGTCLHFNVDAWPAPIECAAFQAATST